MRTANLKIYARNGKHESYCSPYFFSFFTYRIFPSIACATSRCKREITYHFPGVHLERAVSLRTNTHTPFTLISCYISCAALKRPLLYARNLFSIGWFFRRAIGMIKARRFYIGYIHKLSRTCLRLSFLYFCGWKRSDVPPWKEIYFIVRFCLTYVCASGIPQFRTIAIDRVLRR